MRTYILMLVVVYCRGEKQIWNDQTDMLLEYFGIGYKESNSTDIPIMDLVNDTFSIRGLRLGNISTLKRLSDVILETNNGDSRLSGTFGLGDFKLTVSSIRMKDDDFGPAIITSKNNSVEIAYTIRDENNLHYCRTRWERFHLGEFSDIHIQNSTVNENITKEFNKWILPELNNFFESPKFLSAMSKTFEFCDIKSAKEAWTLGEELMYNNNLMRYHKTVDVSCINWFQGIDLVSSVLDTNFLSQESMELRIGFRNLNTSLTNIYDFLK